MSHLDLPSNIHTGVKPPPGCTEGQCYFVRGAYLYYHYGCDSQDDRVSAVILSPLPPPLPSGMESVYDNLYIPTQTPVGE